MFRISKASGGSGRSIISVLETNRRALDIEGAEARGELAERCAADPRATGMGGGSTICAQIRYRLFRLGLPVVWSDGLLVRMMSSAVTPRDVLIVLSLAAIPGNHRGGDCQPVRRELLQYTPPGTPLAGEQADLGAAAGTGKRLHIFKPSTSRYAMLAMVDVLATELAMANKTGQKANYAVLSWRSTATGGVDRQPLGVCFTWRR